MNQIFKRITTLLLVTITLTTVIFTFSGVSMAAESGTSTLLDQASEQVTDEVDATKSIFGKTESGNQLIDSSRNKAKTKLKEIKSKVQNNGKLPPDEQKFVDNLQGE